MAVYEVGGCILFDTQNIDLDTNAVEVLWGQFFVEIAKRKLSGGRAGAGEEMKVT